MGYETFMLEEWWLTNIVFGEIVTHFSIGIGKMVLIFYPFSHYITCITCIIALTENCILITEQKVRYANFFSFLWGNITENESLKQIKVYTKIFFMEIA